MGYGNLELRNDVSSGNLRPGGTREVSRTPAEPMESKAPPHESVLHPALDDFGTPQARNKY